MSSIDDESWAKFLTPWKFDNAYGVPEVPYEDVVFSIDTSSIDSRLGIGKKGSTWEASWKGQKIALKYWIHTGVDTGPYSEWEILNYCRLKAVQGSFIPKLLFVSCNTRGNRVLGLELGRPIYCCCKAEMKAVNEKLAKHGWMQREQSVRSDNFVRMGKEDRLVAVDLESFIPAFPRSLRDDLQSPTILHGSILGIPIVEPSEVEIEESHKNCEWTTNPFYSDSLGNRQHRHNSPAIATWGGTEVTLYSYDFEKDKKSLKLLLERNDLLKKSQGSLIATPLFLARERDGTILLGYEGSKFVLSKEKKKAVTNICLDLIKLGWTVPVEDFDPENFCELDNKILFRDLSCLLPNEDPPNAQCVSSDEMSSSSHDQGASDADEASPLPSSMTLRPLPHRINNKVSSPDSETGMLSMTLRPLPHRTNQVSSADSGGRKRKFHRL